jgi:hypothetical protein
MSTKYESEIRSLRQERDRLNEIPSVTPDLLREIQEIKERLSETENVNRKIQARFGIK